MRYIITMLIITILSFNTITDTSMAEIVAKPIDAFILAYDAMYNAPENFKTDYLILDMESLVFAETTPEDRKKMIEHFSKYNKIVLNASLFKLKEIWLANQFGNLKINAMILMVKNITPIASDSGIKIEGIKYVSPLAINYYDIYLVGKNGNWVLKSFELTGVA